MNNIVSLAKPTEDVELNKETIDILRHYLDRALRGEVTDILLTVKRENGRYESAFELDDVAGMAWAVKKTIMQLRLADFGEENDVEFTFAGGDEDED